VGGGKKMHSMQPLPNYFVCFLVKSIKSRGLSLRPSPVFAEGARYYTFNKVSSEMGRDDSWPATARDVMPTGDCSH